MHQMLPRAITRDELRELNFRTTATLKACELAYARRRFIAKFGSVDESLTASELQKKLGPISEKTIAKHMGSGLVQLKEAMKTNRKVWEVIEANAGSKNSWNARRAAFQFFAIRRMRELKRLADAYFRDDKSVSATELRTVARELPVLSEALEIYPNSTPTKFQRGSGFKPVHMSKSRSLKKAPADWPVTIAKCLASARSKYTNFWLVQYATGCRPEELCKDFTITHLDDGTLAICIQGAKVTSTSGQESRDVRFQAAGDPMLRVLAGLVNRGESVRIRMTSTANAYCKAIKRAASQTFPGLGISAYSVRHQRKADLKAAGLSGVELAQVLGQCSTKSPLSYGRKVRGRPGSVKPTSVSASRPVKVRATYVSRPSVANKQGQTRPKPASQSVERNTATPTLAPKYRPAP